VSGVFSRKMRIALAVLAGVLGAGAARMAAAQSLPLSLEAQAGKKLFFDINLSASKKMSCASCHDPNNHYAPSNSLSVQLGGPNLTSPGTRAVPTLTYKEYTPVYADDAVNPDGVSLNGPGGGLMWDGRADTLAEQVTLPLLAPNEMDNANAAAVVQVVQNSSYAALFQQAYGASVFNDVNTAFTDIGFALEAYQLEDPTFHLYNSKFDLYAENKVGGDLTPAEARGLTVFLSPEKGNCDACHYSGPLTDGGSAIFTDFSYEAIGVPRNTSIPANATRPGVFALNYDLGLCLASNPNPAYPYLVPHTLPAAAGFCGMFKTPTLRNVATRQSFFHNGVFHTLSAMLHWYNTRDTSPQLWYPTVNGVVQKFNDLPAAYRANIDTQVPLDGLPVGGTPHMTEGDLADLQCFLEILTDGYVPGQTPTDPNCLN